jgi:AcrR family transcriptional regulator
VSKPARSASKKGARASPGATRAKLSPLSREAIVATAIELADREGLEAVSLRHVASALDAGPMRLYGHVESKEQLLQSMVDVVYGELERPISGNWREALRVLARSLRAAAIAHPWFIGLLGGRPNLGPNAFAFMESCLAALAFPDIDYALEALRLVKAYAIGAIQTEASDMASGQSREQWQQGAWEEVQKLLATGNYPMMERVVREASHPVDELERGIERVLAGIEAGLRKQPR